MGGFASDDRPRSPNAQFLLIAAIACGILWIGMLVYWDYYQDHTSFPSYPDPAQGLFVPGTDLTSTFVAFAGLPDPRGQVAAYQAMLLATGVASALLGIGWRVAGRHRPALLVLAGAVVVGSLLAASGLLAAVFVVNKRTILGVAATTLGCVAARMLGRPVPNRCFGLLCGAFCAAWLLPGWFFPVDLSNQDWDYVQCLEAHWSVVIGPADRLLDGLRLRESARWHYGLLSTDAAVVLQKALGPFDLTGYVRFILGLQGIYLLTALAGYYLWSRGRWYLCLAPIVLAGAYWVFCSPSYLTPNHTAWRMILFPVAILAQIFTRRARLSTGAAVLGCLAGVSLFHNFETGVAITAGNVVCVAFRVAAAASAGRRSRAVLAGAAFAAGILAGAVGAVLTHAMVTGRWPSAILLWRQLRTIWLVTGTGFAGGHWWSVNPLSVIIFSHACYALLAASLRLGRSSSRDAVRAGAAATLLVWFAYYANRPHDEYLLSYYVVYGFLLIDMLRLIAAGPRIRHAGLPVTACFLLVSLVVLPSLLEQLRREAGRYCDEIRRLSASQSRQQTVRIDGIVFARTPRALGILEKSAYLRARASAATSVYLTADSYLVAETAGFWPRLPMGDAFMVAANRRRYEQLLAAIHHPAIRTVYLDLDTLEPAPPAGTTRRRLNYLEASRWFFRYLREDISKSFELDAVEGGWEIWIPRRGAQSRIGPWPRISVLQGTSCPQLHAVPRRDTDAIIPLWPRLRHSSPLTTFTGQECAAAPEKPLTLAAHESAQGARCSVRSPAVQARGIHTDTSWTTSLHNVAQHEDLAHTDVRPLVLRRLQFDRRVLQPEGDRRAVGLLRVDLHGDRMDPIRGQAFGDR